MIKNLFQNRIFAYVAAVICTLLWGTAFPLIKLGYAEFEVANDDIGTKLVFAGARFLIAGIMVYVFCCVRERRVTLIKRDELLPVLKLGLVQTAAQYLFTYIGIGYTSGTSTSIITACASFITVGLAALFFKEKITVTKVIGCALGFAGVLAINNFGFGAAGSLFGDGMIFCSTVCAAFGNIIAKKSAGRVDPVRLTAFQLIAGSLILLAVGLIIGGRLNLMKFDGVMILLWLAFVSAAAFTIWTGLLKYHPAGKISVFNLLVPVFGTILSGMILHENILRAETIFALLMISLGIFLVNFKKRSREDD
jgi:drug/metabolite transporter (DMT)-like permease